jgi:hypothetical protein
VDLHDACMLLACCCGSLGARSCEAHLWQLALHAADRVSFVSMVLLCQRNTLIFCLMAVVHLLNDA